MSKIDKIPTFNPYELKLNLYQDIIDHSSTFFTNTHHLFHINRIEDYMKIVHFPKPSDLLPHRLTVFSLFFLTKGSSRRSKGLDSFDFDENTFFFVPAHQITTHEFISKDVAGFYCHFNLEILTTHINEKDLINEFSFLDFNTSPLVSINEEAKTHITPLLERLLAEYKAGENGRNDILRIYLLALFTELKPFVENKVVSSSNSASQITLQYKKALSQNIYSKNKITDYAELLYISPNHLNKCVKKTIGKSAHDLLNEMLLLEAKVLLKQTNLNITEIAHKIGKNETSDFARFFKTQTGMRPSEYRELS